MKHTIKNIVCLAFLLFISNVSSAEKLIDIVKEHGADYVVENHLTIAKKIDDKDKFDLARVLLFPRFKGPEAILLLTPLAKKGDVRAISLLSEKYSLGINGIPSDKTKAQFWTAKLEALQKKAIPSEMKSIDYTLCSIFGDEHNILKNKEKEKRYCNELVDDPAFVSSFSGLLLDENSYFYDPQKGIDTFRKCIDENNWRCKANFAFLGLSNPEIAKTISAKQLFDYANDERGKTSPNAVNNIGLFYLRGIGVPIDLTKAIGQFSSAVNLGGSSGIYNIIFHTFFKTQEFDKAPKTTDIALRYLDFYDYLTPQNGRFDTLPFKEWIFSQKRMPTNQTEFLDFLKDKSQKGDGRSSCMLAEFYNDTNQHETSLLFVAEGKKSDDVRVQQWCAHVERTIQATKIYNQKNVEVEVLSQPTADPSMACGEQIGIEPRFQSLFEKMPWDITKGQSIEILASKAKANADEKNALSLLSSELERCIGLGSVWRQKKYPPRFVNLQEKYRVDTLSVMADLYAGKTTFGAAAKTRAKLLSDFKDALIKIKTVE